MKKLSISTTKPKRPVNKFTLDEYTIKFKLAEGSLPSEVVQHTIVITIGQFLKKIKKIWGVPQTGTATLGEDLYVFTFNHNPDKKLIEVTTWQKQ